MSNLEHLIENGLSVLKKGVSYEKWLKTMKDDVNWQDNENISIEQLWTICQYVIYTWMPSTQPERKKGKWINEGRIVRCNKCKIGYATVKGMKSALTYNFCPNCGAKMEE